MLRIDITTAFACFPVFDKHDEIENSDRDDKNHDVELEFFMVELENGMHTIESSLAHPPKGQILNCSNLGRITFFMAGDENENIAFIAKMKIWGQLHRMPIVWGGYLT